MHQQKVKKTRRNLKKGKQPTANIVISGVGGQGIILASNVLCYAAALAGFDVKKSEVHGMAQRGGTVITHVRFGDKVYSPLIEQAGADFLLAFEKLEALRYLGYLKKHGVLIVNDREIPPMSVLVGKAQYPCGLTKKLKRALKTYVIAAQDIARDLGNIRVVNIVLMGVLSKFCPFQEKTWKKAIKQNVKKKFIDLNIQAFTRGRATVI